ARHLGRLVRDVHVYDARVGRREVQAHRLDVARRDLQAVHRATEVGARGRDVLDRVVDGLQRRERVVGVRTGDGGRVERRQVEAAEADRDLIRRVVVQADLERDGGGRLPHQVDAVERGRVLD